MEVAQVNRTPAGHDDVDEVIAKRNDSSFEDEDRHGGTRLRPSG